jgi:hypothetical protein
MPTQPACIIVCGNDKNDVTSTARNIANAIHMSLGDRRPSTFPGLHYLCLVRLTNGNLLSVLPTSDVSRLSANDATEFIHNSFRFVYRCFSSLLCFRLQVIKAVSPAVLLSRIDQWPGNSTLLLHAYCENENAQRKRLAIIMTGMCLIIRCHVVSILY